MAVAGGLVLDMDACQAATFASASTTSSTTRSTRSRFSPSAMTPDHGLGARRADDEAAALAELAARIVDHCDDLASLSGSPLL